MSPFPDFAVKLSDNSKGESLDEDESDENTGLGVPSDLTAKVTNITDKMTLHPADKKTKAINKVKKNTETVLPDGTPMHRSILATRATCFLSTPLPA